MKLTTEHRVLVGVTLFSMFFGAGNLIFPPFLGAQAGQASIPAMLGFCLSAVGLPILGVIAVAESNGLPTLAGRVHPKFAAVFTFLIYMSIGPCLAIPRTATTSFEMAVVPFLPEGMTLGMPQLLYSIVFFVVAYLLALRPDKLTDRLGKLLGPALLILIFTVFVGCLLHPMGTPSAPLDKYASGAAVNGFLEGYQTMDTIAALNFGFIIALNIRVKGVEDNRQIVNETCRAGVVAGIVLFIVYAVLTYIGVQSGAAFPGAANGTEVLKSIVMQLFGPVGVIVLALIFAIACLNTCVGLISCCGDYFAKIFPFFNYRVWACFFAVISMMISNVGLNQILSLSIPVLGAIYPVAITLIALAFAHRWLGQYTHVYSITILLTGVVSVLAALDSVKVVIPGITALVRMLPFYQQSLGWLVPAVLGMVIGTLISPETGEKKHVR